MIWFTLSTEPADPTDKVIDVSGDIWITAPLSNQIFRFKPGPTSILEKIPIPTLNSRPEGITLDLDGNIWFTEFEGVPDKIGFIDTSGPPYVIKEYILPFDFPVFPKLGSRGIAADPSGSIWFCGAKLGCLDPSTGTVKDEIPSGGRAERVLVAPDFIVWFSEENGNKLGRLDSHSNLIQEYDLRTPDSRPFSLAFDSTYDVWFTEKGSNKIGELRFGAEVVTVTYVPSTPPSTTVASTSTLVGSRTTPPVPELTYTTTLKSSISTLTTSTVGSTYIFDDTVTTVYTGNVTGTTTSITTTIHEGTSPYTLSIETDGVLSSLIFSSEGNKPRINFTLTGVEGIIGSCRVTVPKSLLDGPPKVSLDNQIVTPTVEETLDRFIITFHVFYSSHDVCVFGEDSYPIPEFNSSLVFAFAFLLMLILVKARKTSKPWKKPKRLFRGTTIRAL